MIWFVSFLFAFLSGSVLYSRLIAKRGGRDVYTQTVDGNPGAANVFSLCGKRAGAIALTLDIIKGALPAVLAVWLLPRDSMLFALVLAAPVLGHAVGIFDRFHGGKCIATAFGVMIGLLPVSRIGLLLAALYILFSTACKIRSHCIRSIVCFSLFAFAAPVFWNDVLPIAVGCILISVTAIVKHTVALLPQTTEEACYDKQHS